MEAKFKLKVSRMFRSTLDSCRNKSISDVASSEQPFFFPGNQHNHHQLIQLFSPKPPPPRSFPSLCRPKSHETTNTSRTSLLSSPGNPISPANTTFNDFNPKPKHRKQRSKSRKTRMKNNRKFDEFFSSVAANYYGLYSSEDEKENIIDDRSEVLYLLCLASYSIGIMLHGNFIFCSNSHQKKQFD